MNKTNNMDTFGRQIDWFCQIVGYLLNRAEHLPPVIKELIREEADGRRSRYGTTPNTRAEEASS